MVALRRTFPRVAWRGWRVMEGFGGLMGMVFGGVVMRRDPEPCSCRLARSGLGENRQLTSVPSVLLRLMAGPSVIVGHLEGCGGSPPTNDHHKTTLPLHSRLPPSLPPSLPPGLHVTQLLHPLMPRYDGTCHSSSVKPFIPLTRDLLSGQSVKTSSCQSLSQSRRLIKQLVYRKYFERAQRL